jgi:hypothetical protein
VVEGAVVGAEKDPGFFAALRMTQKIQRADIRTLRMTQKFNALRMTQKKGGILNRAQ